MPVKFLREFRPKVREPIVAPEEEKPADRAKPSVAPGSGYKLMKAMRYYARGVHALREACDNDSNYAHPKFVKEDGSAVYRPLTLEENMRARLEDYNRLNNPDGSKRSNNERLKLFNVDLGSCTGIASKKGTSLFKIIAMSEDLISIPKDFKGYCSPITYSEVPGEKISSLRGIYGEWLTKQQVLRHKAWNASVQDKSLLKEYTDLIFKLAYNRNINYPWGDDGEYNMSFKLCQSSEEDKLVELKLKSINHYSSALGTHLDEHTLFIRVTPPSFSYEPYIPLTITASDIKYGLKKK